MNLSAMEIEASVSKEREREGQREREREFDRSCQHLAVFHVSLSFVLLELECRAYLT